MELSRLLLLALLGLSTGYVSRPGLAMRPAMRPAATLRPAAPMNPALTRMMAEETAEDAVAANEVRPAVTAACTATALGVFPAISRRICIRRP